MENRRKAVIFAVLAIALICGFLFHTLPNLKDNATAVVHETRMRDGEVRNCIRLSDGYLLFENTSSVLSSTVSWAIPICSEKVEYEYEDIVAFLDCDLQKIIGDAGVPWYCVPQTEHFISEGYLLTEDTTVNMQLGKKPCPFELHAGTIWGGDIYWISHALDANFPHMKKQFGLSANKEGEFVAPSIDPEVWFREANSRVGEIPVYINYTLCKAPAIGGWETSEFFACFHIDGYSYALYSYDYTQQEFVDVLLAIINHYGAYPSKTAE